MTFYLKINTANIARPNKSNLADYTGSLIYCCTKQGSLILKKAYHQLEHSMTAAVITAMIKDMHWTKCRGKSKTIFSFLQVQFVHQYSVFGRPHITKFSAV
jgi:hypothetical protein